MGFLTKAAREEDSTTEGDGLEEQYMKMYPKIGRDFVHKEDLQALITEILAFLDPSGLFAGALLDDSEARQRAKEYRAFLDEGKNGSDVYADLINLDEDD